MKKKIVGIALASTLLLGSPFSTSYAEGNSLQEFKKLNNGKVRVIGEDRKGPPTFVAGKLSTKRSHASSENAIKFLEQHKSFFNINKPVKSLKEVKVDKDEQGKTHVRLQQMKDGLQVDRNQINVHYNENNEITSVNGNFNPVIEDLEINTVPSVSETAAMSAAKKAVGAPEKVDFETTELVIFPHEDQFYLAYRINVEFYGEGQGNWYAYIDAQTGKVIEKYNAMTGLGFFSDVIDLNASDNDSISKSGPTQTAIQNASRLKPAGGVGFGTTGVLKNLSTSHGNIPGSGEGSTFYLADSTIKGMDGIFTYNMKNTTNQMWLYSNDDASWKDVLYSGDSSSWEAVGQGPAVDAHSNSKVVYDYFKNNHDRNSLDNNGMSINSRVHFYKSYNNAFWSNGLAMMTYGDGDGKQFIPLASLDVTAHEMVHGITHYNGGLRYRFETGAINEAYSDTFAAIVDDANWEIGEDIIGSAWLESGRTALRSNENPGKFKVNASFWSYSIDGEGRYPMHMDEYYDLPRTSDNGGVHINCTILQHSAYLVAEEYGMGREVVADTWYRAYDYLHYDASFAEFREAILQSAIDLYGEGSKEYNSFLNAFDDIGLYEGWSLEDLRAKRSN
ncbi:Zn-dependent metalloprotease [Bacillus mesophilus]|uniref:Neutral metalloproteinase n=1 Tax=Bacillus mesophilus TaxID=1808955 RepID=A0A6M0Q9D8_9BACI|nr:M4 family metallopeptidase [Bacillus mesophilus]MBM7662375.1 Zn-dependent metalloprotease [Bacillus mesophilus]NEY72996.1 peptidase M4 family protein [Bacillus mesophilus]